MLKNRMPDEFKAMRSFGLKVTDEDKGIVEHIITVFGILDEGDPPDISHPGCFKKTLKERGDRLQVLDSHQARSLENVVAIPLEVKEIGRDGLPSETKSKFPRATGGLWAETQFMLDTPQGRNAFSLIKAGAVKEFSFGFDTIKADMGEVKVDGKTVRVRNLRELRLWEYSPVLWGKNQATSVIDVKSEAGPEDVSASGSADSPCDDNALNPRVELAPSDLEAWYLPEELQSIWTREYIYNLADSAFMYVESGGDIDGTEKTKPRRLRHLAIKDANGHISLPHVRNAIQHLPRVRLQDGSPLLEVDVKRLTEEAQAILAELSPSEEKPVDVTANTIRIRVVSRTSCQTGTFRTITIGKTSQGIKALICREKGKTSTSIQTYIFDKSKWTTTRARAWVKKHSTKSVNLTQLLADVREAFYETFSGQYGTYGYYINEVFDDYLVAYNYSKYGSMKHYYKVTYEVSDDTVTFAPQDEWTEGMYVFTAVADDKGDAPSEGAADTGAGTLAARKAELMLKQIEWESLDLEAVRTAKAN